MNYFIPNISIYSELQAVLKALNIALEPYWKLYQKIKEHEASQII